MFMPFSLHTVGHNNVFFLFLFESLIFFKKNYPSNFNWFEVIFSRVSHNIVLKGFSQD